MLPLERVPALAEDDALLDAVSALGESGVNRGLVLDGDRLVGLLSMTDVVRALEVRSLRSRRS
jgi:CBS domain-containing protein